MKALWKFMTSGEVLTMAFVILGLVNIALFVERVTRKTPDEQPSCTKLCAGYMLGVERVEVWPGGDVRMCICKPVNGDGSTTVWTKECP